MTTDDYAAKLPYCPRCGYDLSGVCASWAASCPLDGLCSECGLRFAWVDIFRPDRTAPRWSYEHAPRPRPKPLIRTLWSSLLPRSFWTQLKLVVPIRTARLVQFALLPLLITHLVIGCLTLASIPRLWGWGYTPSFLAERLGLGRRADQVLTALLPYQLIGRFHGYSPGDSPWVILALLCFFFTPAAFLALPFTLRACRVRRAHLFRIGVYSLTPMPLLFACSLLAGAGSPLRKPGFRGWSAKPSAPSEYLFELFAGLPLATLAWLAIFWWFACTRYLKLPHAGGVVAAMMLLGFLASGVLVGFLHPGFASNPVMHGLFWPK